MSLPLGPPTSLPRQATVTFTTPLPSRRFRIRPPGITASPGQNGLVTCVVVEKQSATVHRPPTTPAQIACRIINPVPICAPICISHYLSMSLISPQRSLSPERSTKSVRPETLTPVVLDFWLTYSYSSYVSGLEDRLERMEALLKRVRIPRVC